uniref:Coatomer subunit alpha n=1 Tax=Spumella elongata TaxID=89044 RepID=A0A7S3GXJ7_9STRA|mmetsp:Transcript_2439/g.4078  ORF Transcript_2439/g.4078 Transcript_2439/m.4078 type:complete len:1259 (+) Transcript_2439:69-3845(+)|eukprot:CAMPEP_0184996594 /NCGR_PEP_ID=MMETSP1098-20130426/56939_1 /TAXON_ID=89044 /ORGANISM="Spumella elongata, Strain CCAP 955/1" /LENGTH=1258 /DNA_ID=CAMNT_0027523071 /DNA_START=67 /DNA_END=3843 /DNA_ORIENTATION=+
MDKMLTKFESKSNRVKGLSFHPIRPWILASLHNGHIQLWDYRMGTLLDKFEEHDGPVRGVDFHRTQPLIVSGGDDYKVKVWDYKLRRCLFTLLGHLDYIRTVQFHVEYPWIVSASDDQTIRIWNWQSRHCISVLTGHNHYVMCAAFHPKEDMIVSASLDQTVRVWDTTGLRKKTVRGAPPQMDDGNVVSRVNNELFGGNDAVVKYVLEGHERGVNWASFHPTLPLVISGADDRQVKLWRMNETKAWEVDTMRGHTNNVSCVLFHPKHELIVSNSEDRTIRVWDISKRLGVQTFRRDGDRFWILAVHPEQNLLAAGHDSGMTVFKLERERPAFDTIGGKCFYVKDRYLRMHEFSSSRDVPLVSLRRTTSNATPGIGGGPRTLSYNAHNKAENNVLILSDADGGSYELLTFSTDGTGSGDAQDVRRGSGLAAVFIARDRFAVLDKGRQLLIKNFQNEVVKRSTPPIPGVDCLFFAGTSGRLLLKAEERTIMFDHQARKVIAELHIPRVKYVVWNSDYTYVALVAKHYMMIANKNFEQLCTVSETVRLKGGCWDSTNSVFVYTTLNHVKYVLPNGDRGIIRGLDSPVYVTKVQGNSLLCLDREGKVRNLEIDLTEALFKLALERKDYTEVMRMVKHSRLCGQAIISYLQEKGYPEVALHFVHDSKTRFKLALACGNIQVAMNVAYDLGDDAWRQLGVEALRQGNHEVVEMSYQKTKEFDSLSFLYLLTGNTDKLRKMQKIAEMRGDAMSCVHNALYLGDAEERVKIIEATGQLALAYLTAKTHGLEETAARLVELLESSGIAVPEVNPNASLLQPPTPIYRSENWPQLAVTQSAVSSLHNAGAGASHGISSSAMGGDDFHDAAEGGNWGDDDDLFDDEGDAADKKASAASKGGKAAAGEGGWGDDDLDLSDDDVPVAATPSKASLETTRNADGSIFTVPNAGNPPTLSWIADSAHCADHFAAGSADTAVQLLNRQVAAVSVAPLRAGATSLFLGSSAFLPGFSLAPSNRSYLVRDTGKAAPGAAAAKPLPSLTLKVTALLEQLKLAYRAFTNAQFTECQDSLDSILRSILLISVSTRTETNDLKELLDVSREYLIALRVKNAMGDASAADVGRGLELAAYFTHCNLQPSHLMLALKTAMASAFKNKNFINAASFARRLLELPDMNSEKNADSRSKAQKVLQKSEQQGRNEYTIDYDERNPFSLDCSTLKPLYKGTPLVKCSYCAACYAVDYKGKLCLICGISTVGLDTVGLVTQSATARTK